MPEPPEDAATETLSMDQFPAQGSHRESRTRTDDEGDHATSGRMTKKTAGEADRTT